MTILLSGDELIHWASTTDGYTIMTNSSGAYEYAVTDQTGNLIFSGVPASDPEKREKAEKAWLETVPKGLFFSAGQIHEMKQSMNSLSTPDAPLVGGFPSTGTRKLLLILANYSNTAVTYYQGDFTNFMNQVNYNGTGSFRDYYLEVSYGQLTVNTTVTVWVTLPNTHDFYGPQANWGQFAYDAIVAANMQANVNFAEYDNNLDGIVDGVAIIHQGQGQEESGNANDIWSHSWDLISAGFSASQRTFNGVQVNAYTAMPERNATGIGTIGVMCHEFCHNLGAPDFYDTDYSVGGYYTGTGKWDLMAGGSWNGVSGSKPAHPNPWIKELFNWTEPVVLSSVQNVTLRNAAAYPDVVRYNTQTANEYFLCENRQQTGFDAGIPGHGLIIYHVDGTHIAANSGSNSINTTSHQGMYPVCANSGGNPPASYGTINDAGCPFPGTSNKTAFTDITTPHARSWAGAYTNFPITGIFEYSPTHEITFCFVSCNTPADPLNFSSAPASTSQVGLSWGLNTTNDPVMVAFNATPSFGAPDDSMTYTPGCTIPGGGTILYNGTNTVFYHTGLNASTTYYYKAWSVLPGTTYSPGVTSRATTLCGAVTSFPWHEGFENSGAMPGCWTQEYINNSGLNWLFIAGNGSVNPATAHTGSYNACLKDKTVADHKTRLVSPVLNLTTTVNPQLSFWHTQPVWGSDQDKLSVYFKTSATGSWTLLATYAASIAVWTQETISLPNPCQTYYIGFEGNAKFGHGICLDDVQISEECQSYAPVSVSVSVSMNPVFPGTTVTNTASIINGGSTPCYQWKVDGLVISGATNNTFITLPSNNDEITCVLTSSLNCVSNNPAISDPVVISVTNTPLNYSIENLILTGNECFNALQSVTIAGNESTFSIEPGGNATIIAGQMISFLPGTKVHPGGYLNGYITTNGQYCGDQLPAPPTDTFNEPQEQTGNFKPFFRVYPNPVKGPFTVELDNSCAGEEQTYTEIYNMQGVRVNSKNSGSGLQHKLTLAGQPSGIYILSVISGRNCGTVRLIKITP